VRVVQGRLDRRVNVGRACFSLCFNTAHRPPGAAGAADTRVRSCTALREMHVRGAPLGPGRPLCRPAIPPPLLGEAKPEGAPGAGAPEAQIRSWQANARDRDAPSALPPGSRPLPVPPPPARRATNGATQPSTRLTRGALCARPGLHPYPLCALGVGVCMHPHRLRVWGPRRPTAFWGAPASAPPRVWCAGGGCITWRRRPGHASATPAPSPWENSRKAVPAVGGRPDEGSASLHSRTRVVRGWHDGRASTPEDFRRPLPRGCGSAAPSRVAAPRSWRKTHAAADKPAARASAPPASTPRAHDNRRGGTAARPRAYRPRARCTVEIDAPIAPLGSVRECMREEGSGISAGRRTPYVASPLANSIIPSTFVLCAPHSSPPQARAPRPFPRARKQSLAPCGHPKR
jgi:hypothetical protein